MTAVAPVRLVAVVGPTASGKTALAIRIAEAAHAEVVSIDSQQVYRGMDIGTGKASAADRARVPHHLLDVADPDEPMTAARFVALADAAIAGAAARGRPVVLAGGTGLYYRALIYGLFEGPPADAAVRARLAGESIATLAARLAAADPEAAARIDANDRIRMTRALEVLELTGRPISEHQREHDHRTVPPRYDVRGIGLDPPRAELTARIEQRVDEMIAAGLVDEVRALAARYPIAELRAFSAIGYREIAAHVDGKAALDDAVRQVKQATRRYARRQRSWFRAEPSVTWYKAASDVDVAELSTWLRTGSTP